MQRTLTGMLSMSSVWSLLTLRRSIKVPSHPRSVAICSPLCIWQNCTTFPCDCQTVFGESGQTKPALSVSPSWGPNLFPSPNLRQISSMAIARSFCIAQKDGSVKWYHRCQVTYVQKTQWRLQSLSWGISSLILLAAKPKIKLHVS